MKIQLVSFKRRGTTMAIGVLATLKINPECTEAFEAAFSLYQDTVLTTEPGTLFFGLHRNRSESGLYTVMEQYVDDAAFSAHQTTEHYLAIPQTLGIYLAQPPKIEVLDAL